MKTIALSYINYFKISDFLESKKANSLNETNSDAVNKVMKHKNLGTDDSRTKSLLKKIFYKGQLNINENIRTNSFQNADNSIVIDDISRNFTNTNVGQEILEEIRENEINISKFKIKMGTNFRKTRREKLEVLLNKRDLFETTFHIGENSKKYFSR